MAMAMARKHCDDCSGEPGYVLLSSKPIIFSREQMSIYVRVKELWAFGVAHKLAVIIMILASLGRPASRMA